MKTDVGDVLESMDDMVTSLSTFLKSIGDNKGEATFTHLREKCTGTRQGDKDSELENVPTFLLTPICHAQSHVLRNPRNGGNTSLRSSHEKS